MRRRQIRSCVRNMSGAARGFEPASPAARIVVPSWIACALPRAVGRQKAGSATEARYGQGVPDTVTESPSAPA